ncbi:MULTISPECIES: hypothetical protein [Streptomyces]|uniref:DUF4288 domain-containing protein n=2 Tax=Streptomyces TaxID=1883 RepID=A0ABX6W7A7_STRMQ|nr:MULTISPECIES: hypothetical protein [Streptomyces]AQA12339.1 hypothetical protein BV401_19615 [Streptomyces autolyticus]MCC4318204.1 hypothetical protein [Streptomyces malaysiensis]MCD9590320.1 hypothetical protein [Streptomyces sp. 8ZJF_21]MCM3811888.1 hypothetical protein [Streptomyces sp. DR7-3]MCQ6249938.1 hypothetical protein [Streptomyces malaysiensis]
MTSTETSRFVRLRVDLVVEIADPDQLRRATYEQIDGDESLAEEERGHARRMVESDEAEALAYLVEPFELVEEVPGVELVQASWSSEHVDYDPRAAEWSGAFVDLDEDD